MARAGDVTFGYPAGTSILDIQPDYMKPLIDPHWAKFPPVNPMWHYVLGLIYVILIFLGFFGNLMVIWLFMKHDPIKTPSNFLVVNLALSDMIMMVTNCPFFIWNCFNGGVWDFSIEYCAVYAALGAVTGVCSIWTLACISADRFNIICNGFNGPKLTKGKATMMSLFCWAIAVGCAAPPFFGWGGYSLEGNMTSCSFDYLSQDINHITFSLYMFIVNYCVPLLIIIGSYIMIVKAIWAHEEAMRAQAAKMNVKSLRSAEANEQRAEIRIAKVAIANTALWIVCWCPYAITILQGTLGDLDRLTPLATMLPSLLAKTASCYNPFVYALSHPKFRLAITQHMKWFCVHQEEAKSESDGAST